MHTTHDRETQRLDVLAELDILDTPRELAFDRLTGLCRKIFRVPMSTLTLIDGHRQWFKASRAAGGPRDRAWTRALQPRDRTGSAARHSGHAARPAPRRQRLRARQAAYPLLCRCPAENIRRGGRHAVCDGHPPARFRCRRHRPAHRSRRHRGRRIDAAKPVDARRPYRHLLTAGLSRRRRTADRAGLAASPARCPAPCSMSITSSRSMIAMDTRSATWCWRRSRTPRTARCAAPT